MRMTNPKDQQTTLQNHGLILMVLVLVVLNVLAVIWSSHWLRPAADDYCFAWITGQSGVLGSVIGSWNAINGYLTSIFYASLWVGWPLAYLPLSLASALPFILAALGIGLAIYYFIRLSVTINLMQATCILFLSAFLWWGFLWLGESFKFFIDKPSTFLDLQAVDMSLGLTHWQTLNGQHILQLVTVLIGVSIAIRNFSSKSSVYIFGIFLLGIFSGMTGPTLAASIIVFAICYLLYIWKDPLYSISRVRLSLSIFIFSTLLGLLFTQFLSPGIKNRQAMLGTKFEVSIAGIANILNEAFQFGFAFWLKTYFSLGAIFVFIFITAFIFLYRESSRLSNIKLAYIGLLFSIFALLQMIVNRASEFFAYQGYWHFVSAVTCIFISIVFFGISLGCTIAETTQLRKAKSVAFLILLLAIGAGTTSNFAMIKSFYKRQAMWSGGAAPVSGVTDIDVPWVRGCWVELNELRPTQIER